MRLYQYPMRCSNAIQLFLDTHPQYWPFVPLTNDEADRDNHRHLQHRSMHVDSSRQHVTSIQRCVDALPKPPAGYRFSMQQIRQQYEFFERKLYNENVYYNSYVYSATIIAVLPLDTSDLFREMLHALFVTHAETKLNTLGHLFPSSIHVNIDRGIWCAQLVRRRLS
jgi:hypothetical protein